MNCLSCHQPMTTQSARLWERKILMCKSCGELADKALAELQAAQRRAEAHAMMFLEQQILRGQLLTAPGIQLPGFGELETTT